MDRYEEYKDSGVDWIGEIPAGWEVDKVKRFCSVIPGATPSSKIADYWNGDVPWITPADYSTEQHYVFGGSRFITEKGLNSCGASLVPRGSVIVSNRAPIGQVAVAAEELCTNQGCKSLVPLSEKGNSEYLYWYLSVQSETLNSYGKGTTFLELSSNALADFPVPSLAPSEQECIVGFLKRKTAEIDSLVEDCEREVELLREYRKAVISEAVTKGLDPNAPMKDSGIDWIGEIPEGWEVGKVKYAYINRDSERVPVEASKRNQSAEVLYPYYGASGVVDFISDFIFDEPLLLIGEDGANLRLRNLPLIYAANGRYWVNNHAHILQPAEMMDYRYSFYQLELVDLENYLTGSTQPKLTAENLGLIPVAMPSMREQQEIAAYLDVKTAEIDSFIADYRSIADKLREYRKSLISEAVTGKFKVPGVA